MNRRIKAIHWVFEHISWSNFDEFTCIVDQAEAKSLGWA